MYQDSSEKDGWKCPNCGSENFQRVSVIHESGRFSSSSTTETIGVGASYDGEGIGAAASSSSGFGTSDLSRRLAPPPEPRSNSGPWPLFGFIGGLLLPFLILGNSWGGAIWGIILCFTFCIWGFKFGERIYKKQNEQAKRKYESEMLHWRASCFCFRCDHIFQRA